MQNAKYDPATGQYIFSKNDLALYSMLLDEFKTRHQTLSDKIEATYRIGNLMRDYLEKQIILDYHLRGEQQLLEKDHPELVEKAKKYLGFELYYELTKDQGKPLPVDSKHFKTIMAMSEELNKKYHQEINIQLAKQKDHIR